MRIIGSLGDVNANDFMGADLVTFLELGLLSGWEMRTVRLMKSTPIRSPWLALVVWLSLVALGLVLWNVIPGLFHK